MQLKAIASHLIASYLGEETNTRLATISFWVVVETNKAPLSLLFSRLNNSSSLTSLTGIIL